MKSLVLHYKIAKGFKSGFFCNLCSRKKIKSDDTIQCIRFWINDPNSRSGPTKEEVSHIFAAIICELANSSSLRFYFPYNIKEVNNKIEKMTIQMQGSNKWLWFEMNPISYQVLNELFQMVSFTNYYAQVGEDTSIPMSLVDFYNNLRQYYAAISFELFDDTIEILSGNVSANVITDIANKVCAKLNIQVKEIS